MKTNKAYKHLPLFRTIRTKRSTVSLKSKPFLHVEIKYENYRLIFPIKELLRARRFVEGLSKAEKKAVMELLELTKAFTKLSK